MSSVVSPTQDGPAPKLVLARQHTCLLGGFIPVSGPRFGYSYGARCRAGLNGHTARLRLWMSLLLPSPVDGNRYYCNVPVDAVMPLFGALRHFWGPSLRIIGDVRVRWHYRHSLKEVSVTEEWDSAPWVRGVQVVGDLKLEPIEVTVTGFLGPRQSVQVNSLHLQWESTSWPGSPQARRVEG